jgi:hypothetical protein
VTECPVKGLQEGHEYMFRVKAVNDEGESEPLESDAAIKAKDPYGETGTVQPLSMHEDKNKETKIIFFDFIDYCMHAMSLRCFK